MHTLGFWRETYLLHHHIRRLEFDWLAFYCNAPSPDFHNRFSLRQDSALWRSVPLLTWGFNLTALLSATFIASGPRPLSSIGASLGSVDVCRADRISFHEANASMRRRGVRHWPSGLAASVPAWLGWTSTPDTSAGLSTPPRADRTLHGKLCPPGLFGPIGVSGSQKKGGTFASQIYICLDFAVPSPRRYRSTVAFQLCLHPSLQPFWSKFLVMQGMPENTTCFFCAYLSLCTIWKICVLFCVFFFHLNATLVFQPRKFTSRSHIFQPFQVVSEAKNC